MKTEERGRTKITALLYCKQKTTLIVKELKNEEKNIPTTRIADTLPLCIGLACKKYRLLRHRRLQSNYEPIYRRTGLSNYVRELPRGARVEGAVGVSWRYELCLWVFI